jgi:hypothetical protein
MYCEPFLDEEDQDCRPAMPLRDEELQQIRTMCLWSRCAQMPLVDKALELAALGYKVFPLAPGEKVPFAGSRGANDATTDPQQIRQWWSNNPLANIGIATDGLLVIDCDPEDGGPNQWELKNHDRLSTAPSTKTPRGRHYFFAVSGVRPKSSVGQIAPHVDIKAGAGSYVVAPGSFVNDNLYYSETALPLRTELALAPAWLIEITLATTRLCAAAASENGVIPEGSRNNTLFSIARHLRREGLDEPAIEEALQKTNRDRCAPPLDHSEVSRIANSACRYEPNPTGQAGANSPTSASPLTPFTPFPVEVFPEPVREYVLASAAAIGCCPSFVALPLLSCLAAAIGSAKRLKLKSGWLARSILWTMTVGESGTAKSPASRAAVRFTQEYEQRMVRQYDAELAEFKRVNAEREAAAKSKRSKQNFTQPEGEPIAKRVFVSDTTVEALVHVLKDNPRGVLLCRDEMAAWFGGLDRYAKTVGGDEAAYLSMFDGGCVNVDRRTSDPRRLYVPAAFVSICGTIQPGVLSRAISPGRRESGLLARFLLACPPRVSRDWSENEVSEELCRRMQQLFDRLFELAVVHNGAEEPRDSVVEMSPEAKQVFVDFHNRQSERTEEKRGDLAAAFSKLTETAGRLALIFHCVRNADGGSPPVLQLSQESMESGVRLAEWLGLETERVYRILSGASPNTQRLVDWIAVHGGRVTVREVQQGCRWLKASGSALRALEDLVATKHGCWEQQSPSEGAGRPTGACFVLKSCDQASSSNFVDM